MLVRFAFYSSCPPDVFDQLAAQDSKLRRTASCAPRHTKIRKILPQYLNNA